MPPSSASQKFTCSAPMMHQELADEARRAGQSHRGHGEHHEHQRIARHPVRQPAVARDLARVEAVIDDAHDEEQRGGDDAVRQHLKQRAVRCPAR